ncbi:PREDICTED: uncharacterized protein LOC109481341 isoform X1 [Branchiostoma belcheri]|uniref:Uncharacterized protein LOC109481341 isoform X1 n=1 Tax=Branchiostoma belcheri TaxID=7741 RepID=A0A6P5ACB5_BRABE|nr:PREDICTED: uncharacterized protein LOC109481341 isoform X1 [Branchiostoma belcheri]
MEYSNEVLKAQGGSQRISAAITEFYTTSFGTLLKAWLESINEFPKAFEFTMQPLPELLDMNLDSLFPSGITDYGCFGGTTLQTDEHGRKFYTQEVPIANSTSTTTEVRYCDFAAQADLEAALSNRRLSLQRANAVYLEEGSFLFSDFSVPAGEPGCETAELALLEEENAGAPTWQYMTSGQEFTVIFDMPGNIPNFLTAKASLDVKFVFNRWLTVRKGFAPHLYDGHDNGYSGDVTRNKISVGGLVMSYEEDSGLLSLSHDDFVASSAVIPDLPEWANGMTVARAEYKSLLARLSQRSTNTRGDMPCNLKWSNSHRIDPSRGGRCIHFTAASEGDMYVVFAGIPRQHETWIYLEISPKGVAIYKAMRLAVTQFEQGSTGLGSATLYQSYFVCVTEDAEAGTTVVQYGKTPDNEERAHVWLDYKFREVLGLEYYAFGSGTHAVKLMGVTQLDSTPEESLVCREGTRKDGARCIQVCHAECEGCRTTGSDDPRDCIGCLNKKVPFPYLDGVVGDFECVADCPDTMYAPAGSSSCECIKRMDAITAQGVVTCVAECPLTHYDDNNVCRRCSSFCDDVSDSGDRVCTGPEVDQCHTCLYRDVDGACTSGCNPGQQAVAGAAEDWDLPASCPTNDQLSLPNDKSYVAPSDEQVDYATAQARCAAEGGTVALPMDSHEQEYLVFFKNCLNQNAQFWVGLSRPDGTWVDSQGSALGGFTAWAPGEPNDGNRCAHLVFGAMSDSERRNKWADAGCGNRFRYICETSTWLSRGSFTVLNSPGTPNVLNGVTLDAAKTLDGNFATYWNPGGLSQNFNNWYIELNLRTTYTLTRIGIRNYGDTTHDVRAFKIQAPVSGIYSDVRAFSGVQAATTELQEFGGFRETAQFWKFVITETHSGWQPWLRELEFMGETCGVSQFRHVPDTDCPGGDISSLLGTTLDICASECCANPSCQSFQFNDNNNCYLKTRLCTDAEKISASAGNMYDKLSTAGCSVEGYVPHNGACYKSVTEAVTYADARQTCAADGGTLAMPKDSATNTFLSSLAPLVGGRWLGLTKDSGGAWVWADGQTLTSSGYDNWLSTEPSPDNGQGGCMGYWGTGAGWDEKDCSYLRAFICQLNEDAGASAVFGATASTFTCEACPPGYRCVNGDEVSEICPAGSFSRADGTACDPCPAGEFTSADGARECQACPAGQFNTEGGSTSCQACPENTYSHPEGQTSCEPCAAGSVSAAGSGTCSNINECSSNPCRNGGICNDETNRYSCTCRAGYTGYNCQTNINECASNPCRNGGNCVDGVNRFTCECQGNYMGTLCDKAIRLVGGSLSNEGRVEVLHNGQWGTVCDDSWDINDAHVVCRSLGYPDAHQHTTQASFGPGSGSIWLDDVGCRGTEGSLADCPHNGWGNHNCGHSEDAGVVCSSPCPNPPVLTASSISGCGAPYTENESCSYSCNAGYFYDGGSKTRTCSGGGSWSGTDIVCTRQTCYWEGTAPFCNPGGCDSGIQVASGSCGDGACCWTGHKIKCCNGV